MSPPSPLWPTALHHFRLDSDRPDELARFYVQALGMAQQPLRHDLRLLTGPQRRMLIGRGERETVPYVAFAVADPDRLGALRRRLGDSDLAIAPSPSPLFGGDAFAIRDPDGLTVVFGTAATPNDETARGLPGRLQHIVFASTDPARIERFYADRLGFVVSDRVFDDGGALTASFLRSNPEHHSFATFRAPQARFDHFSHEAGSWNDIRDWADHFGRMRVPLWWGPGRHGPGDNLFFMVRDPDGNRIEISAELELMEPEVAARSWPHEQHTLNLWGQAWMRS